MPRRGPPFNRKRGLRWTSCQTSDNRAGDGDDLTTNVDVGGNLRRLREERRFTIRRLAGKSGLAINTLSLIENGKSSPSVTTLQQLAGALEVPITAFFEGEAPKKKVAFIRANQRPRATFDHGILEDLGAGSLIQAVEPFVVTLEPHAASGSRDIVHTGYEFVYCLQGQIAYTVEGEAYSLKAGDSLLFAAYLPHHWQNLGSEPSQSILVLYPVDEHTVPIDRLFA
jgi:transcriptional regulator with XRE-family HTH domain